MRSVSILRLTIALTCVVSIYQALLFYLGIQTTDEFDKLWGFAFVGLLAWLWLVGLILLACMGTLMQWVVYAAS